MYSKSIRIIAALLSVALLSSCGQLPFNRYSKYESTFMQLFDTYSIIVGYAKTDKEFSTYTGIIYNRLNDLHQKFDIYNDYDGVANLKTVNDNAGVRPVEVSRDIIDLLKFGRQAYADTNGTVNIAMGSVLRIWHDYRQRGIADPDNAELPPMDMLEEAAKLTDINDLVIDEAASSVYLRKKGMSLDVGAVAKGYAAQVATDEAIAAGMTSALINIGGNICSVGKPLDNVRDRWGVGIQDPALETGDTQNILDTVYLNDAAVVTSGNYQRFYEVDGKSYNHIIDGGTLMPAERYQAVTVVCEDSAVADMLSTSLYILPMDDGKALLNKIGGEAVWIHHDSSIEATDGYIKISKKLGNYGAVDENTKK